MRFANVEAGSRSVTDSSGRESAGCRLSRVFWEYEAYLYEFKTNPVPGRPGATAGDQGPC